MTHLSLAQITGLSYYDTFEKLFEEADLDKNGAIPAMQAAKYLKRSGLSDLLLSKIWDQADSEQRGQLNKQGFFIALKLIALAQQGLDPSLSNLTCDIPPPKLAPIPEGISTPPPPASTAPATSTVSPPVGSMWEISTEEHTKFEQLFISLSPEGNRLSGEVVRPVLLQSGLGTDVLVAIWDLADVDKDGFLDKEEFVLAMNLTQRRLAGKTLPDSVPPAIVSRMKGHAMGFENNFLGGFGEFGFGPPVADIGDIMRESEGLLKEVEEIKQQKLEVDMQVLQLESDLKLKQAEMKVMQRELDHMAGTYHQLEMQKEEAQKRLDEFGDTAAKLKMSNEEYDEKIKKEEDTIRDLQDQLNTHEQSARSHEEEIALLRSELNELMVKESALQEQLTSSNRQLAALQRSNQQSGEELKRKQAATGAVSSCKSQLEEVLGTLNALLRGEVPSKPLPSDDVISSLLDNNGPSLEEPRVDDISFLQQQQQQQAPQQPQQQPQQPQQQPQQLQQQPPPQHFQHQLFQGNEVGTRAPSNSSGWGSSDPVGGFGPSGAISSGHQFRPASASPQPSAAFPAHFPTPAAWPPVSQAGGSGGTKSPAMSAGRPQPPPSSKASGLSASPVEAPTKSKSKKSKYPFSRSKKSREHASTHHEASAAKPEASPSLGGPPGVGDFADFSRFEGVRSKACPSEDEQLAWAKMESQRIQRDEEKMRRQEEAELQYAIQLSKMNS